MTRAATLTRAIQTQWGLFAKGCTVRLVARDDEKAIVDFAGGLRRHDGREMHMYSVIRPESVTLSDEKAAA